MECVELIGRVQTEYGVYEKGAAGTRIFEEFIILWVEEKHKDKGMKKETLGTVEGDPLFIEVHF